jgi:bacillithiol biosynthesis cysteine-adding enzyme BshC
MECTCVRYTDLPGASRLLVDFLYHPERLEAFYPLLPHRPESFAEAARAAAMGPDRRAALIAALRKFNGPMPALDVLARDGTVAVVTGQQVGLFSGPAYTVYKALTAIRLAERLSGQGIPAVPIFWLATEDHDFAEVNHVWMFDGEGRPAELRVDGNSQGRPVGEVVLPALPDLESVLAGLPFGEEAAALVRRAYQPGRTMGQAFGALLGELTSAYGLIQIDPMQAEVRTLAAPLIREALDAAPDLTNGILERNGALEEAGYHAQVHVEPHTSLVFLLENGRRLALRRNGSDYQINGRVLTTTALKGRAEHLSPNALLRPVVQDWILPTAAYVGGPAELAYLAQSEVIYRALLGRMPAPVHRAGFTLLDARGAKLMRRYGLALTGVLHPEAELRERIGRKLIPPALAPALETARSQVLNATHTLQGEMARFDPGLAAALEKSRRKIEYQITKMERKISREMLARDARAGQHASYLHHLLFPEKHLQERLYSIIPFLARHGLDLTARLYENVHLDCADHQLLTL